ncbi:hypothetical protein DERP_000579 [Dermatophagoides pteronyssinus]|uniref:Uncharacterized protein n=1 Tax=Dermatophagoides pteronyssinus TaxID=6956 RepID=A0ABQ8J0R6_DERPT|nr:hypothetical protein DERP_000579 [Dermatophagoides pteronyssinus]
MTKSHSPMINNQSLNSQLTIAAAAAAAAAAASACSPNFQETFFHLNDDDKRQILQSFIYKQLNGSFNEFMCNNVDNNDNVDVINQIIGHHHTTTSSANISDVSTPVNNDNNKNSGQSSTTTTTKSSHFNNHELFTNKNIITKFQSDPLSLQTLFQTFLSKTTTSSIHNNNNNNNNNTNKSANLIKSYGHIDIDNNNNDDNNNNNTWTTILFGM